MMQTGLWKTKTFWIGVCACFAAVVNAVFSGPADTIAPLGSIVSHLFGGTEIWIGLAAIAGRDALLKKPS